MYEVQIVLPNKCINWKCGGSWHAEIMFRCNQEAVLFLEALEHDSAFRTDRKEKEKEQNEFLWSRKGSMCQLLQDCTVCWGCCNEVHGLSGLNVQGQRSRCPWLHMPHLCLCCVYRTFSLCRRILTVSKFSLFRIGIYLFKRVIHR